jgi:hypothetical protein
MGATGATGVIGPTGEMGPAGSPAPSPSPVYVKTVIVSPVGTAVQNGDALVAKITAISGNNSSNRFLLKIEPGFYDLGTKSLVAKSFVDIEGSGELTTRIKGADESSGVVRLAVPDTEVRQLTIEGLARSVYFLGTDARRRLSNATVISTLPSGGAAIEAQGASSVASPGDAVALREVTMLVESAGGTTAHLVNVNGGAFRAQHMTASVTSAASSLTTGFNLSTLAQGVIEDIWIELNVSAGSATAMSVSDCAPSLARVTATAAGSTSIAFRVFQSATRTVTVRDSLFKGGTFGVQTNVSAGTPILGIANTQVIGGFDQQAGTTDFQCFDVYDGSFAALSCPN